MLEVNHTPSFNVDTQIDKEVKTKLLTNTLEIMQLGIELRRKLEWELKQEMKQQIMLNQYKRASAKDHSERVRFPPGIIENITDNKFRLIYPKQAPGPDPDLYIKFLTKADSIWKSATGTFINEKLRKKIEQGMNGEPEEKKKKKKKKKKPKPQEPDAAHETNVTCVDLAPADITAPELAIVEPAKSIESKPIEEPADTGEI